MHNQEQLPTIPGFFADPGRPYETDSCKRWLSAFGYSAVPSGQDLPTPLGLRIHDYERDMPHALKAIEEGLYLGFTPHLNFNAPNQQVPETVLQGLIRAGVVVSYGNSTEAGSGFQVWNRRNLETKGGHEIQDDSGVRSAVSNLTQVGAMMPPVPTSLHHYGNAGAHTMHLGILRAMFPLEQITIMELHWGFRGDGNSKGDKPELYTPAAGAFIFDMVVAAHDLEMDCCLFSFRDFFKESGAQEPSMQVLTSQIPRSSVEPLVPPTQAALTIIKGMLRRRAKP